MNVYDVCTRIRSEKLDDAIEPYLWSNTDLINYLNDTLQELSDDTLLIKDQTTTATCQITLADDTYRYAFPSGVIHVSNAWMTQGDAQVGLIITTENWLNTNVSDWRNTTGTYPTHIVPYYEEGYMAIFPMMDDAGATDIIYMTVKRSPATVFTTSDITAQTTISSMHVAYTDAIMNGMTKRAFLKPDSDTYDRGKSEHFRGLFEMDKKRIRRKLILLNKPAKTLTIREGQGIGN